MKKQVLLAMLFLSTLAACTKNAADVNPPATPEQKTDNGKLYAVNINLGKFETEYVGSGGKVVAAKDYLKALYYCLYDSTGTLIKMTKMGINVSNIPIPQMITDSLPKGTYTMVLTGSDKDSLYLQDYFSLATSKFSSPYFRTDVFYKKNSFVITNKDTVFNNLQLERISGALEINLTDTLALASGKYLRAKIEKVPVYYSVINGLIIGNDSTNVSGGTLALPSTISCSMLGSSNKLKITLQVYSYNPYQVLYEKVIDDVYVYPNKKTILTGKLFSPSQSVSGNVVVDDSYSDVINQTF